MGPMIGMLREVQRGVVSFVWVRRTSGEGLL